MASTEALAIVPTASTLGAVVTGVNLASLLPAEWQTIHQAFLEHGVLIFPGQNLDTDAQRRFGERFGELERNLVGERGVVVISNKDHAGSVRSVDDPVMAILRGNEGWHTDSSYMPISAKASILSAREVPQSGGETEWADMRAAYDELDETARRGLEGLVARHSLEYSQTRAGEVQKAGYGIGLDGVPLRPLVKVHPETGRAALFIGRHAHAIDGMTTSESEALLDGLLAQACTAPRTYKHRWAAGDVAVWDNRCVLHRAHSYDYSQVRVMVHTRVAGDPATESAVGFEPSLR